MKILEKNVSRGLSEAEYDTEIAYAIFKIEIDYGIGMIKHDTPVLKLFHYTDEANIKRYNKGMENQTKSGGKGSTQTFK